jgi:NADPH:quinone reductase-like Zn-dependent oxidoreductase
MVARNELTVAIDKDLDLEQIVTANERVDTGHTIGNVIVRP